MSNLTLRQVTSATDPGSTSAKGSALSHTEMDSNLILLNNEKLENVVEDTTPQLGGTLDTNDKAIGNSGSNAFIDIEKRVRIDENAADYSLLLDNQNTQGLGLKIKAGDDAYAGSLAILSVADKDDTLVLTAKASGEVIVYDNLTVDDVYISSPSAGQMQISTLVGDDLNITTNAGTLSLNSLNFPGSDGSANQVLKTDGSGALGFADVSSLYTAALENVSEDTTPSLGGELDQNGNMIKDDSRNYQILGNVASPSGSDFDSFNSTARVYGVVKVDKTSQPSNRYHSNPTLSHVTMTADAGSQNGRLRMNYFEGMLEMDGFDNTQTGFGRGQNGIFSSTLTKNSDTGNAASTLAEQRGLTLTTQAKASSTGGLTISDSRCINMEPNINANAGGAVTITNQYGLYYASSNNDTANSAFTNEYSFYGNTANASTYNAGGYQMPVLTVANLSTIPAREGNTAYVTNNTAGTGPVAKCLVFYDGSNWKLAHEPGTTAA